MRKTLAIILALTMLIGIVPFCVSASDSVIWSIDDGTLTISGAGVMDDFGTTAENLPEWYEDRLSVNKIEITAGVTTIGAYAFNAFSNLASVTLPEGITAIGGNAFLNCTSLGEINLPDSLTSLGNSSLANTGLNELTIPAGVSSFGSNSYPVLNNSTVKKVIFAKTSGEYTRTVI